MHAHGQLLVKWSPVSLLLIQHSKLAYVVDFVVYFFAVIFLVSDLWLHPVALSAWAVVACLLLGGLSWSLIEYGLHRFLLHGCPPFLQWHHAHHLQPCAFICTATVVSLGTILVLVYAPLYWLFTPAVAITFTLGLMIGYLGYAVTHHAIHHWAHPRLPWLQRRQKMHALHHGAPARYFGVTSTLWDRLLQTGASKVG